MACSVFLILLCMIVSMRAITDKEAHRRSLEDALLFPMYPTEIPSFPVRTDPYSSKGEPVSRGRLYMIGGLPSVQPSAKGRKYPLKFFKQALQCSQSEAAMDELYGTLSLMLLSPPTEKSIKLLAAWAETGCANSAFNWEECNRQVQVFEQGRYPAEFSIHPSITPQERFQLIRIINGTLYHDWPWGIDRINSRFGLTGMFDQLVMALNALSDVKDSVFLFGGEHPMVPWTFPIAHFSMAGSMSDIGRSTNTIVWPWEQEFYHEVDLYNRIMESKRGDFSPDNVRKITATLPWDQKTETRAAFYTSYDNFRWVIMEQAARHPDLFDLATNNLYQMVCWTPDCPKWSYAPNEYNKFGTEQLVDPPMSGYSLLHYMHEPTLKYKPGHYKYIVVPAGMSGASTSSRLLYLLAHCECVVLLVTSHLQYHISARLKPWVHYVPLASSGADVAAKVRWLQHNDHLARQIAKNGHNFGLSYLRLEDYLCYAATAVEALGEVMANTTALQGFSPRRIE